MVIITESLTSTSKLHESAVITAPEFSTGEQEFFKRQVHNTTLETCLDIMTPSCDESDRQTAERVYDVRDEAAMRNIPVDEFLQDKGRRKSKKSKSSKQRIKALHSDTATGFEEYFADCPLPKGEAFAEVALYSEEQSAAERMEMCIQRSVETLIAFHTNS